MDNIKRHILFFLIVLSAVAHSEEVRYWGPEFEFTSQLLKEKWDEGVRVPVPQRNGEWTGYEFHEAQRIAQFLIAKCKAIAGCRSLEDEYRFPGEFRFEFADGFWIRLSYDPAVIEFQMQKLTIEQLKAKASLIEDFIFKTTRENGFFVSQTEAGHLNAGVDFVTDPKHAPFRLMSYLGLLESLQELWQGGTGYFSETGRPLAAFGVGARNKFSKMMSLLRFYKYEKSELTGKLLYRKRKDQELLEEILKYLALDVYKPRKLDLSTVEAANILKNRIHDKAVNIDSFLGAFWGTQPQEKTSIEDFRIELRAIYAQKSIYQFIAQAEFFEALLKALESNEYPLIFINRPLAYPSYENILSLFFVLCEELNLDFKKYRRYVLSEDFKSMRVPDLISGKKNKITSKSDYLILKELTWYLPLFPHFQERFLHLLDHVDDGNREWVTELVRQVVNNSHAHSRTDAHMSWEYSKAVLRMIAKPAVFISVLALDPSNSKNSELRGRISKILDDYKKIHPDIESKAQCLRYFAR